MKTFKDPQEAFQNAIEKGYLFYSIPDGVENKEKRIKDEGNKMAENWMYMHTIENEGPFNIESGTFSSTDYFKNINTREYMEVEYY